MVTPVVDLQPVPSGALHSLDQQFLLWKTLGIRPSSNMYSRSVWHQDVSLMLTGHHSLGT